jgi:hypothetical protein
MVNIPAAIRRSRPEGAPCGNSNTTCQRQQTISHLHSHCYWSHPWTGRKTGNDRAAITKGSVFHGAASRAHAREHASVNTINNERACFDRKLGERAREVFLA